MRGTIKPVSLSRNLVIDFMRASVPLVVVRRTMSLEPLAKTQALRESRRRWMSLLAKAFCIVARDEPWLRTFYMRWPWPHFNEMPKSVCMAVIVREDIDRDAPLLLNLGHAEDRSLEELNGALELGKTAPLEDVPSLRLAFRTARLPWPLRRVLWAVALNIGLLRPHVFGTFCISSAGSLGAELLVGRTPGPTLMTYGPLRSDHTMETFLHFDHRIYDGVLAARALHRIEEILNTSLVEELLASGVQPPDLRSGQCA